MTDRPVAVADGRPRPTCCAVTVTYYPDPTDARFDLARRLCRLAARNAVPLVVVDGSPDRASVAERLREEGGDGCVRVFRQDVARHPGKGGALRQAIARAAEWLGCEDGDDADDGARRAICFTEPEKVDLLNHVRSIVAPILRDDADVVVPTRNDASFRDTYPIEQYHSESFGNAHFNLLAGRHGGFRSGGAIDWLFGPFAFRARLASAWLEYGGTSWDAQMIPYTRGVRDEGWRIASVTVDFRHPKEMKEQEEGDERWTRKRLMQLNLLFDLLGDKELARR